MLQITGIFFKASGVPKAANRRLPGSGLKGVVPRPSNMPASHPFLGRYDRSIAGSVVHTILLCFASF